MDQWTQVTRHSIRKSDERSDLPEIFPTENSVVWRYQDGLLERRARVGLILIEEVVVQRQPRGVVRHATNRRAVGGVARGSGVELGGAEVAVEGAVEVDEATLDEDRLGARQRGGWRVCTGRPRRKCMAKTRVP